MFLCSDSLSGIVADLWNLLQSAEREIDGKRRTPLLEFAGW
jgi:hypothetical protein